MTTQEEIRDWFNQGKKEKATHMIVVCDTFDHSDYPVFVKKNENVRDVEKQHNSNMQQVMEVYNLSKDLEDQLSEFRSFNY